MRNDNNPLFALFLFHPKSQFIFTLRFVRVPVLWIDSRRYEIGSFSGCRPVLLSETRKQRQCDKPQLPENRIFACKAGVRSIYEKSFFSLSAVRCAELSHDDRLRRRELPGSWVMTTVFMAAKSIFTAIKTVVIPEKRQIDEKDPFLLSKNKLLNLSSIKFSKR